MGTPYRAVHLYFSIVCIQILASKVSLGKTIQLPCDKAANAPKTEPKQWKKGTGKHILSFIEKFWFRPTKYPLLIKL